MRLALVPLLLAPVLLQAQAPKTSLAGLWTLQGAYDLHPDGRLTEALGPHPEGLLFMDAEGRYALQIYRAGRAKFSVTNVAQASPEEAKAALTSLSTHMGRVEVNEAAHTLTFHIAQAANPNWSGTDQVRPFELKGDELTYRIPAAAAGTGLSPVSVWRRVR